MTRLTLFAAAVLVGMLLAVVMVGCVPARCGTRCQPPLKVCTVEMVSCA